MSENKQLPLPTTGEMLQEEFMKPLGLSAYRLAKDLGVPATRIHEILKGRRTVTAETGLRMDRYFGLSEGWWLRLQADCDLRKARRNHGERIAREVRPRSAA
ncbi:MAG: HigA family addiction module antitoxin [Opitutales bacterium]